MTDLFTCVCVCAFLGVCVLCLCPCPCVKPFGLFPLAQDPPSSSASWRGAGVRGAACAAGP